MLRACVRSFVCACVHAYVYVCVCACVYMIPETQSTTVLKIYEHNNGQNMFFVSLHMLHFVYEYCICMHKRLKQQNRTSFS